MAVFAETGTQTPAKEQQKSSLQEKSKSNLIQDRDRTQTRRLMVTLTTPGVSRDRSVVLRGRAAGTDKVRIYANGRFLGSASIGNDGRYEKTVRLRRGDNRVRVTVTKGNTTRTVMKIIKVRQQ